jgi:hypothetical protein
MAENLLLDNNEDITLNELATETVQVFGSNLNIANLIQAVKKAGYEAQLKTAKVNFTEQQNFQQKKAEGLGLRVDTVQHPFEPESGAYAQHQHDHRLSPIKSLHHVAH